MLIDYENRLETKCSMEIFDAETGEKLGKVEKIKSANMAISSEIDYSKDKHGNMLATHIKDSQTIITFDIYDLYEKNNLTQALSSGKSRIINEFDIVITTNEQIKNHKKKRINKKWLKRYGCIVFRFEGYRAIRKEDGTVAFVR